MYVSPFDQGYQTALADIAEALDQGGENAVRAWLAENPRGIGVDPPSGPRAPRRHGSPALILLIHAHAGDVFQTPDGPLTVSELHWRTSGHSPDEVVLSADGRSVDNRDWCQCDPAPTSVTWVRYERYEIDQPDGNLRRVAHGFACQHCRKITQSG